ncbi:hypothetical protein MnBA_11730 [Marinobacterium sp. BA1]
MARLSELSATLLTPGAAELLLYYPVLSGERLTKGGVIALLQMFFLCRARPNTAGALC